MYNHPSAKNMTFTLLLSLLFVACNSQASAYKNLDANAFEQAISGKQVQLVDVRTPGEHDEKHIANSLNYNINDPGFEKQMKGLDKNKPVYLYCLSGGRSGRASEWAVNNGFKEVYNLEGGINGWINAKKPIVTPFGENAPSGMTMDQYLQQIKDSKKLVLVDFNAVWCGPCRMLKPIVQKVTKNNPTKMRLLDVDVDKNSAVANAMNIRSIPLMILYKDGKEVWRQLGLVSEEVLQEKIDTFSK